MLAAEYAVKGILIDLENTLPHALIGVDMQELVLTGCMHKIFYEIGKNADAINFRRMDGEMIRINFGIKNMLI